MARACTVERSRLLAGALALLLAACGEAPELPPPGAESGLLQLWRRDDPRPIVVHIDRSRQVGADIGSLVLTGVMVELPLAGHRLWLRAPGGRTAVGGDPSLVLDGPVRLSGWRAGRALVGVATSARLAGPDQDLVLDDLRLVHAGGAERMALQRWAELWSGSGASPQAEEVRTSAAPALWVGGLGAAAAARR